NRMNWKYSCKDPKVRLYLNLDRNLISHLYLIVQAFFNGFTDFTCYMKGAGYGTSLLDGNPIECDCLDYLALGFYQNFPHASNFFESSYCNSNPTGGIATRVTTRPLDQLLCYVKDSCPANCTCINQPSNETFH